ncbi:hypothetical protein KC19_4G114900 [Ceratodon purpureus]|uniref:Uncharacterized protein n=1 Tax=Ceratodon purpureus TaxID=3225 RepID=A0A8T0I7Y6_CERPU|nr:hypothetical protein KC19_4G114900 [Ceratodon purpureus]
MFLANIILLLHSPHRHHPATPLHHRSVSPCKRNTYITIPESTSSPIPELDLLMWFSPGSGSFSGTDGVCVDCLSVSLFASLLASELGQFCVDGFWFMCQMVCVDVCY